MDIELPNGKVIQGVPEGTSKEVIMQKRKIKADEAYRWLQKRSMDSRKSIRQIAEAVLLSEEL